MTGFSAKIALLASAVGLGACGGDGDPSSGVAPSTPLVEASSDELEAHCEWTTDLFGGSGHSYECEVDGATVTYEVETVAQCVALLEGVIAGCEATIGDAEECARTLAPAPCDSEAWAANAGCQALARCR